jgi:predicted RecA/RadA family phage recombinase
MQNYVQESEVVDLPAPYDRLSGQGALIGSKFGVAKVDVLSGVTAAFLLEGVVDLAATSAQVWAVGDKIYWDDTNKRADNVATVGLLIGVATLAKANPGAIGRVLLNESVSAVSGTQAAIAALTGAGGGTANGSLVDEGTLATAGGNTYSDAAVNTVFGKVKDNIAELAAKVEAIRAALHTAGIIG